MSLVPLQLNHASNAYLTVYFRPSSSFLADPSSINSVHPALTHVGPVGALKDVQVLSVSKFEWDRVSDEILASLSSRGDIEKVEVQDEPKARVKRSSEF